MRVIVEQLVEWRLAGETEVLGKDLPQRHFVHHKSHMTRPGLEPGPLRLEGATNRLNYGAAFSSPATSFISPSSIVYTSISWPLVRLSVSPRTKIRGLHAVVFLRETCTLITCHFYILKQKKPAKNKEKAKLVIIFKHHIKSSQSFFTVRCLVTAMNNGHSSAKFSLKGFLVTNLNNAASPAFKHMSSLSGVS
jgi:hypothetical protein